jgi:uncharacterized protein (DUF2062 family)
VKRRIRKYLPEPEAVLARKWAAPFRPWLGHPNLWHFNRRSVPGAVAVGLFCGMIPGPVQMLTALLFAIPFRSNIPLAMFVTWYTNPLTIVPIYLVAYELGRLLLGYAEPQAPIRPPEWAWTLAGMWQWVMSLGKPLGVGMVALALVLAAAGYLVTALGWRWRVLHAWRRRRLRSQP